MNTLSRDIELHDVFAALADSTRLRILRELRERHERCQHLEDYLGIHVTDLTEAIGLSQPAVSKHLGVLKAVGLVKMQKRGTWSYYTRNEEVIEQVGKLLETI